MSLRRRWISTGEKARQGGHGQHTEDEEGAGHHEGGDVVSCDVLQES